jgi:hypothetical protein
VATGCSQDEEPTGVVRPSAPSLDLASTDLPACLGGQPGTIPAGTPLAPGDYYTTLLVDPATTEGGDGRHFTRITDAIATARAGRITRNEKTSPQAACRITISVSAGTYRGSFVADPAVELFPLVLDVPKVTLEGGLRMQLDAKNRATGNALDASQVTTLEPVAPLAGGTSPQAIVIVTDSSNGFHGDGINDTRGDDVVIRGFSFRSGYASGATTGGGLGIFALRAQNLVVSENRFETPFASALDSRAGTLSIARNSVKEISAGSCAFCLAGPGNYQVTDNYVARSGIVGVFLLAVASLPMPAGVRAYQLPSSATVTGVIQNNLIRDQVLLPVGTAIRVVAIGSGAGTVPQSTTVSVLDNEIAYNRFGMIFDGGFPPFSAAGNLAITLGGNTFTGNDQNDLYVAFARHNRGLGLVTTGGYLKQSTYSINLGGNLPWSSAWYAHPATDNGVTLNNTLLVDGAIIPNANVTASGIGFVGLKTSDDVGTKFDLRSEILKNSAVIATGQVNGVSGGSSGFNNAVRRVIASAVSSIPTYATGDTLAVRLSVRIAVGVAGHTSGTARLWYGDASAVSGMTTLVNGAYRTYYLGTGSTLSTAPGAGPRSYVDVLVNKNTGGNPFKPFGTWKVVF